MFLSKLSSSTIGQRFTLRNQEDLSEDEASYLNMCFENGDHSEYRSITRSQHPDISIGTLDHVVFPYFRMLQEEKKLFGFKLKEFAHDLQETIPPALFATHAIQLERLADLMGAEPTHLLMVRTQQFKPELIINNSNDSMDFAE